jgi:hypothetical protein
VGGANERVINRFPRWNNGASDQFNLNSPVMQPVDRSVVEVDKNRACIVGNADGGGWHRFRGGTSLDFHFSHVSIKCDGGLHCAN